MVNRLLLFVLFLPLIVSSTQAEPATVILEPPPGITLHLTNSQMLIDGAGVIFAATRPNSSQGGAIVWRVVDGKPEIVLSPGLDAAYGNGELVIWSDGYARYVVANRHNQLVAYPVPGWVKVP